MTEDRQKRIEEFLQTPNIPPQYFSNSTSEEKLLEFSKKFIVQYHKYFPDRKPLLLTPTNEVGVQKMICTFIRPTSLIYDDLFEIEKCSSFVAGYLRYEPLHDPSHYCNDNDDTVEKMPQQVVSPRTALHWQIGNCLELSLVLTSLLNGAGYNAYVVVGYATSAVCLNDQRNRRWMDTLPEEQNSDDDEEEASPIDPEYASLIKPRPQLKRPSEVVFAMPSPLTAATSLPQKEETVSRTSQRESVAPQKAFKSVHCWVMVLPGGRKTMLKTTYIEPSTGELIAPEDADEFYLGVESVFNEKKYYVNLAPETPVSELSCEITNASLWESVLQCGDEEDRDGKDQSSPGPGTARRTIAEMTISNAMSAQSQMSDSEASKLNIVVPRSWVGELTINPSQYESRYHECYKLITYWDAVVESYAAYSQQDLRVREVHVPDDKYPDVNQLHIFYEHRADKLRRRSVFPLPQTEEVVSTQYPAAAVPSYRLLQEWYEPGRMRETAVEGLREFSHEPGKTRIMKFYWKARVDGLYRREEHFYDMMSIRKVKEFYKGRDDKLCYRSATFDRPRSVKETNMHNMVAGVGCGTGFKENVRLEPIRMSQKFIRNPDIPFQKDVAKTTFLGARQHQQNNTVGEIWVFFQFNEGSVIRPYHMFAKPSSKVEDYIAASASRKPVEPPVKIVTMPGAEPPSDLELFNERKWLNGMETMCLTEIRAKMDETMDILRACEQDHNVVRHILSSYDTLRNRPKETEAERARMRAEELRREESRKDYLAPYIAKLEMPSDFDGDYLKVKLTLEQAKQVRDEALLELKERLIQRGHIMQNRMDKEKEDFNSRQILYQKNCDAAAVDHGKEAEEFALYCKEATWRMKVLDERLSKHIDQASEKYASLAQRLSEDPRLSVLYA
eukprot:gene8499-5966_t